MAGEPLSVTAAVGLAKAAVEGLSMLVVTGEVSGFRGRARSGHCYFQLKDDASAMDAIIWRGIYDNCGFELRDGMQLLVTGGFQIYAPTGKLSFVARHLELAGEGLLRQQVAALARKLQAEGLMDESRKRPIPRFCTRVAVVTSPSGSVIDDVKRTLARRNPLVEILVAGTAVQGIGAPTQIMAALDLAASAQPDAILLVRGGGSFEDLMTFNDEALARHVAACPVPVICGIGHEPDTCICDMVCDRRCSTPTAAAESVAPTFDEIITQYELRRDRLASAMEKRITDKRRDIDGFGERANRTQLTLLARLSQGVEALAAHRCLQDPLAPLKDRKEQLELSLERMDEAMPRLLGRHKADVERTRTRLVAIGPRLSRTYESELARSAAALDALSPLKVLSRGYSIVRGPDGHVLSDASHVEDGDTLQLLLAKGTLDATVTGRHAD